MLFLFFFQPFKLRHEKDKALNASLSSGHVENFCVRTVSASQDILGLSETYRLPSGSSSSAKVFRQQVFYQFRPLQETEVAAVEIIFVAHIVNLIEFLDAVEIEVVEWVSPNVAL